MNAERDPQARAGGPEREAAPRAQESAPPLAVLDQIREVRESIALYAAARTDGVKLAARNALVWVVVCALTFVGVSAAIIFAVWHLMRGASMMFVQLFGDRAWAGPVATGAMALLGIVFAGYYVIAGSSAGSREKTFRKYETRLARQRAEFGRDIHGDRS